MSIVKTMDALKKKFDSIDKELEERIKKHGYGAYYQCCLDVLWAIWEKGKATEADMRRELR